MKLNTVDTRNIAVALRYHMRQLANVSKVMEAEEATVNETGGRRSSRYNQTRAA